MIRWQVSVLVVQEPMRSPVINLDGDWEPFAIDRGSYGGGGLALWVRRAYDDGQPPFGAEEE